MFQVLHSEYIHSSCTASLLVDVQLAGHEPEDVLQTVWSLLDGGHHGSEYGCGCGSYYGQYTGRLLISINLANEAPKNEWHQCLILNTSS